tara:strand:+ start:90 stop:1031 length:942 start_codon:yes stop_codon:yes gene_type:complete
MKILVTGGAGFLGSHLCERLIKSDHKVYCVDNFFTGRIENIEHLKKNENFQIIDHDIQGYLEIDCDQIYNLACPASPVHYQHDPVSTIKTSILGTINLLELAKNNGAIFFQASTSEIYGDPEVHPQDENYWGKVNPIGPRACYDEGKRCSETLCFDYKRQFGLEIKVVRIFNTYGPRMQPDDGRVVSNFIVQSLKNEPMTVYGDGSQTRSFCYVDDLINGFVSMMEYDENFSGPINLGNPKEITIYEIAKTIKNITNSSSEIIFKSLPEDDPQKRKPDIGLAMDKINWQPKVDLDQGLVKTIKYFESRLNDTK